MIDYEKLKVAMELATKINCYLSIELVHAHDSCGTSRMIICFRESGCLNQSFDSIEDLIAKLQELTKPEPKYKLSDEVFILHHDMVQSLRIHKNPVHYPAGYYYLTELGEIYEAVLFPTRQALIEHQIEYWRNQLEDELDQHVSPYCEPTTKLEPVPENEIILGHISALQSEVNDLKWRMNEVCNTLSLKEKTGWNRDQCEHGVPYDNCGACNKPVTENSCDNVDTECMVCSKLNEPASISRDDVADCQHIPSRKLFLSDGGGFECIKCGEFYR